MVRLSRDSQRVVWGADGVECEHPAGLPPELRLRLPDGTSVLGMHASPGADDGAGILCTCQALVPRGASAGKSLGVVVGMVGEDDIRLRAARSVVLSQLGEIRPRIPERECISAAGKGPG